MSTPSAARIELGSETLQLERGLRDKGPAGGLVLRAWPAGCTVSGGTIQLPRSAVLLLTGHGAHFRGTTFSGVALHVSKAAKTGPLPTTPATCAVYRTAACRVPYRPHCMSRCLLDSHPDSCFRPNTSHTALPRTAAPDGPYCLCTRRDPHTAAGMTRVTLKRHLHSTCVQPPTAPQSSLRQFPCVALSRQSAALRSVAAGDASHEPAAV